MKDIVKTFNAIIILIAIFSFISCNNTENNNADELLESKQKKEIPVLPVNVEDSVFQVTAITADGDTVILTQDNVQVIKKE